MGSYSYTVWIVSNLSSLSSHQTSPTSPDIGGRRSWVGRPAAESPRRCARTENIHAKELARDIASPHPPASVTFKSTTSLRHLSAVPNSSIFASDRRP